MLLILILSLNEQMRQVNLMLMMQKSKSNCFCTESFWYRASRCQFLPREVLLLQARGPALYIKKPPHSQIPNASITPQFVMFIFVNVTIYIYQWDRSGFLRIFILMLRLIILVSHQTQTLSIYIHPLSSLQTS